MKETANALQNVLTTSTLKSMAGATTVTLDDLWNEALAYGRPRLSTSDKKKFWAVIEFDTTASITLKAEHAGYADTPHEALRLALEKAAEIKGAFK